MRTKVGWEFAEEQIYPEAIEVANRTTRGILQEYVWENACSKILRCYHICFSPASINAGFTQCSKRHTTLEVQLMANIQVAHKNPLSVDENHRF